MNISSVSNINFQNSKVKAFLWANSAAAPPCFDNKKSKQKNIKNDAKPKVQKTKTSEEISKEEAVSYASALKACALLRRNIAKQKLVEYKDFYASGVQEIYHDNGAVKMRINETASDGSSDVIERFDRYGNLIGKCEIIDDLQNTLCEITEYGDRGKNFHQFLNDKIQSSFVGISKYSCHLEVIYDEDENPTSIVEDSVNIRYPNTTPIHLFEFACEFENGELKTVKELAAVPSCERNVAPRYDIYKF